MANVLVIHAVAHAVNTVAHPAVPPGWRWAVHLGDDFGDLDSCLNAGWAPTSDSAQVAAEAAAVCAHKVAALYDPTAAFRSLILDHDPIPAGGDRIMRLLDDDEPGSS